MDDSYWMKSSKIKSYPPLGRDLEVDVAIVGGGITGVTAAYLLKKAGKKVALLERDSFFQADTAHTTAHLTYVTDSPLSELVKTFGRDHARAAWDAGQAAIDQIVATVKEERIDCEYRTVPGFTHTSWDEERGTEVDHFQQEAELARELGFDAKFVPNVEFAQREGVRYSRQGLFHPLRYLEALLRKIEGGGSHVFAKTEATEFEKDPFQVKANGHSVRCGYLVIASHVPLTGIKGMLGAALFQTKLAPYSTYAMGASLPKGTVPEALYEDSSDPYVYIRMHRRDDDDYVIIGGEDHKTGQEKNAEECYAKLESRLKALLPSAKIDARWTGQVIETHDGLPYIGENEERQFIATGYAGNGMTFGTLAGMMATDAVLGRKNPWKELFDPKRTKLSATWDYIKENADYPYYYIKDKLTKSEGDSAESLAPGEGRILKIDGERVAAFKDEKGNITKLSPVCTHMGCIVHWNTADSTWDCPCHGSRFLATGEVLGGPAETPLEKAKE